MESNYHVPVLLQECIDGLAIKPNGVYVDVTFGGGGHSREILKKLGADGILADLGVSSHQFNEPERGFSTRFEADLDMRMDQQRALTAAVVLNTYAEEDLHKIFGLYGEVQNAKSLARTIVTARLDEPIRTLSGFKNIIAAHIPRGKEHKYMAQVFQALRIEVNAEIEVLERFLEQAAEVLKPGGRLVVISYHSLEDRPVKNFLAKGKFKGEVEKDFFGNDQKPFNVITRKAIVAGSDELARNSRSRSAKLRIGERLAQ